MSAVQVHTLILRNKVSMEMIAPEFVHMTCTGAKNETVKLFSPLEHDFF